MAEEANGIPAETLAVEMTGGTTGDHHRGDPRGTGTAAGGGVTTVGEERGEIEKKTRNPYGSTPFRDAKSISASI